MGVLELKFIEIKEIWYLSAFINSRRFNEKKIIEDIKNLILNKAANITDEDLSKISYNKDYVEFLKKMGKNISINVKWRNYIEDLQFLNEETGLFYDTLGFFEFEVEYFKDNPEERENIRPLFVQQIPIIIKKKLIEYFDEYKEDPENKGFNENDAILIDKISPIYIFYISNKYKGENSEENIKWTVETISNYKRSIGKYTVLYSGEWEDYSDELYKERSKGNLSNRLSELHYIRRNSGFIFMEDKNYRMFFDGYMRKHVITPTAKMRALIFAIMTINHSLDTAYGYEIYSPSNNIKVMEERINRLKNINGAIQLTLNTIYNELYSNQREHYTKVLRHLKEIFSLEEVLNKWNDKFGMISGVLGEMHRKQAERIEEEENKALNLLGIIMGAGIFFDFGNLMGDVFSTSIAALVVKVIGIIIVPVLLIYFIILHYRTRKIHETFAPRLTVDAVVLDDNNNIVMVTRKYPPFKGKLALPGGFIERDEDAEHALVRELKEETNLDVKIIGTLGRFDDPKRDPRGRVITTAYLCKALNPSEIKGGDDASAARFYPLNEVIKKRLAFDHNQIINKGIELAKTKGLLKNQ